MLRPAFLSQETPSLTEAREGGVTPGRGSVSPFPFFFVLGSKEMGARGRAVM